MKSKAVAPFGWRGRGGLFALVLGGLATAACPSKKAVEEEDEPDAAVRDAAVRKDSAPVVLPDAAPPPDVGLAANQGKWDKLPAMEMPRFYSGVGAARGRVFVIGGVVPGGFAGAPETRAVHAFDPKANAWEKLPNLPDLAPAESGGLGGYIMPNVAAAGDRLYVLGALEVNHTLVYDFDKRAWNKLKPVPVMRGRGAAATGVGGTKIFYAGGVVRGVSGNGLNTGIRQADVFVYDTATDAWETLPALPLAIGYSFAAVIGNELYVMGGSSNRSRTDQVMVYDVTARRWLTKAPLPVDLSSAAGAFIGGKFYITGGIATSIGMITTDTLVYDPDTSVWQTLAPLPTPRFAMGAAVVDGRMYVPSGMGHGAKEDEFVPRPELEAFTP